MHIMIRLIFLSGQLSNKWLHRWMDWNAKVELAELASKQSMREKDKES
jgi:hypothetical protein